MELDLDINNYDFNDILNLFKIPSNFSEEDLKMARKIALKTHPDKSGLDQKYFFFYSKAYKLLYSFYEFKNKSEKRNMNTDYTLDDNDDRNELLYNFFNMNDGDMKDTKKFNKWFNEQFNKYKQDDNDVGYQDWLKSDQGLQETCNISMATMGIEFENRKTQLKSVVKYNGIRDMCSNTTGSMLGESSNEFASSMFSNLPYQDLKQAHTETIIPINEEDYHNIKKFKNEMEYAAYRNNQDINPMKETEAYKFFDDIGAHDDKKSMDAAYFYAKQLNNVEENKNMFWSNMQKLTNE